jgi:WD40 repeat protein
LPVCSLTFGPDGRTLAVGFVKGIVKLFDPESGQERGTLHGGEDEGVLCLAFSPDGATLAAAGDDRVIRLWDVAKTRQRQILVGHGDWVESLAFTADGKTLASGSRDGTVRFWSPVSGRELLSVETPIGIQHLAFSRDGKRLAGAGSQAGRGGEVYLWCGSSPSAQAMGEESSWGQVKPKDH